MYPWHLFLFFLLGICRAYDFPIEMFSFIPTWASTPTARFRCAFHYAIGKCSYRRQKGSRIHDYFRVVLHDTFLPRWVKEQSGYWRVMWYIHYLSMKNLFSLHSFTDFIYIIYTFVTRSTSEDDTDQLDCTGLTHIPISPRNLSHHRPPDLRLSLESLEELVENLLS